MSQGWIPSSLVFDHQPPQLQGWEADEAAYTRQQLLWLQTVPPTQHVEGTIRRYEIQKPHANYGAHHSMHHVLIKVGQAPSYDDTRDKKSPTLTR